MVRVVDTPLLRHPDGIIPYTSIILEVIVEIGVNYKYIREFDISGILEELPKAPEVLWNLDKSRQGAMMGNSPHKHTQSLYVNVVPLTWDGNGYPFEEKPIPKKLREHTDIITKTIETLYGGRIGRALYIRLKPNCNIPIHQDHGYYLRNSHRFHVPIITNDNVKFYLNGDVINMKAGSCYEINNAQDHAVNNESDIERIHLVFDIIPMESFKSL